MNGLAVVTVGSFASEQKFMACGKVGSLERNIQSFCNFAQEHARLAGRGYVNADFDTIEKAPFPAEKGHKARASEVPHRFDASFGSPFSAYSVCGVVCLFRIRLPCKIGSRGIIKKCGKIKRFYSSEVG